jgi:hypothetical protein
MTLFGIVRKDLFLGFMSLTGLYQARLHAKAKGSPSYRFYALYDKIDRKDILAYA